MRSIWFREVIILTIIIGISTSTFATPVYVVDDYRTFWRYSSKIVVMDSEAPHNEIILNADTGERMTDIAVTPTRSRLYTITGNEHTSLYRFDINDGHLLDSWNLGIGGTGFKNALIAESETSLLFMSNDKKNLWRINLDETGNYLSTNIIGNVGLYSSGDLAISPDGVLYFSSVDRKNSRTAKNRLYTIDLMGDEPAATEIGVIHKAGYDPETNWLTQIYGLAFDENGILYGGRGSFGVAEDIYAISLNDGSATFGWTMQNVGGINGFASAPAFVNDNIPEPATVLLLTLGTALIKSKRK